MMGSLGLAVILVKKGEIVWASSVLRELLGQGVDVVGKPVSQFLKEKNGQWFLKTERGWERVICSCEANDEYEAFLIIPMESLPIFGREEITDRDNFLRYLNRVLMAHRLEEGYIALILIDIVDFKRYYVLYTEEQANEILVAFFARMKEAFRKEDIVAKVAGDDFAVVVKVEALDDLKVVAERVLNVARTPIAAGEKLVELDVVIGIAVYPFDGLTAGELLKAAESVVVRMLQKGLRNNFDFYSPDYVKELEFQVKVRELFYKAMEREEFVVFYQPIVNIETRTVVGAEALVRWDSPELGFLSPSSFIPVIERSQEILELSLYVCRKASNAAKHLCSKGKTLGCISFNITPIVFRDPNIISRLKEEILSSSYLPIRFMVEITEDALFEYEDELLARILDLRESGIRVAIDDFGTGYSTLQRIVAVPVDLIKVDKFFVSGLPHNMKAFAVVKTVKVLSEGIEAVALAEGVETKEQEKVLRDVGYKLAQGFYYYKPMPFNEFEAVIF